MMKGVLTGVHSAALHSMLYIHVCVHASFGAAPCETCGCIYTYAYMGSWDAQDSQFDSVLHLSESFTANLYGQVRLD